MENKKSVTGKTTSLVETGAKTPTSVTVVLDEPIKRGDQLINEVTVRKPKAGELRGVSLIDLGNLSVIALQHVLPRITTPTLTNEDVARMDPADLTALGAEVSYFLVRKADRNMVSPTE